MSITVTKLVEARNLSRINKQRWQRKHTNCEYAAEYIYLE